MFKLFDTSLDPWFRTDAARQFVGELGAVYNQTLLAALPPDPRIQIVDTGAFVNDLLQNADRYGFIHGANDDACAKQYQLLRRRVAEVAGRRPHVRLRGRGTHDHARHALLGDYVLRQSVSLLDRGRSWPRRR